MTRVHQSRRSLRLVVLVAGAVLLLSSCAGTDQERMVTTSIGDSPGAGVAELPADVEGSPPTSVEVTDLPDGYVPSARDLFPADVKTIETEAAELFGPRLALIAEASTAAQPAITIFVVRASPEDLDAGATLTTGNVEVLVHTALASRSDLGDVAVVINNELIAQDLATDVAVLIAPMDQHIIIQTASSADAATVERVHSLARDLIDQESARIAAERPDTVDIDVPWSTSVLQFATVHAQDADLPID